MKICLPSSSSCLTADCSVLCRRLLHNRFLLAIMYLRNTKGAFTENYVLQQLKSLPHTFIYYYSNENSTMEIDFVVQHDNDIIPVEVKAEENLRAKSLRQFINDNPDLHGIRFSMSGHREQEWMTNVPLWAVKWAFD